MRKSDLVSDVGASQARRDMGLVNKRDRVRSYRGPLEHVDCRPTPTLTNTALATSRESQRTGSVADTFLATSREQPAVRPIEPGRGPLEHVDCRPTPTM